MQTQYSVIAFAADNSSDLNFNLKTPDNSDAFTSIASYLAKYIPAAQGLGGVVTVLACIAIGIRLGASTATGDSRMRQEAIVELFWLIVAGVIIIHAKEIIGLSSAS